MNDLIISKEEAEILLKMFSPLLKKSNIPMANYVCYIVIEEESYAISYKEFQGLTAFLKKVEIIQQSQSVIGL